MTAAVSTTVDFLSLWLATIKELIRSPLRRKEIFQQLQFVAVESLPVVLFCVCFAAIVVVIEASFHMRLVIKNDSLVPGFAAILILRELGAVVSALLVTSRVGAGLTAEVGSMKITEQIDALRMLGINPIQYLVVPRFVACVLGGFMLSVFANVTCLIGAMIVTQAKLGYTYSTFLQAMRLFVSFQDLLLAGMKGAVFGGIIPIVSCFYGFRCQAGAEGVGRATTNSVVAASVLIIVSDFILSWLFSNFY